MNNFEYIFKHNKINQKNNKIKFLDKKYILCQINNRYFGEDVIIQVIDFVRKLNVGLKGFPILFKFSNKIEIVDKLSYIIFECICYYLIEHGYTVFLKMKYKHDITTCGIENAPLNLLLSCDCKKYVEKFTNEIYKNHYCKLITQKAREKSDFLSFIYTDIDIFLRNAGINDKRRNDLSETISELIGNASEHTSSDCYIDIDVTDDYYKNVDNNHLDTSIAYNGVNIVILNFSDNLLNQDIKIRVKGHTPDTEKYKKLTDAYNYHKQFFDIDYTEDDFFNIAVFQNRISGNIKKVNVGGTGLTYLINSLQKKSESDNCYVLSGCNILMFHKDYLSYNEDWIGFNKSNDFFRDLPEKSLIGRSKMFFSGTAYNLNFVMKREDNDE